MQKKVVFILVVILVAITSYAQDFDRCDYYYQQYGNTAWFKTWKWFQDNCPNYFQQNLCGNNILDPGEDCDTEQVMTCDILGFTSGPLFCDDCQFDTSRCYFNGTPGEDCETVQARLNSCNIDLGIESTRIQTLNSEIASLNSEVATCQSDFAALRLFILETNQSLDECLNSPMQFTCSETDDGNDPNSRGETTGSFLGISTTVTDTCRTSNILNEYFCPNSTAYFRNENVICSCENGECQ